MTHTIPELLAPAGNKSKFLTAVAYGADAVYLSGQQFGLRAASDNFTEAELIQVVSYAHARGVKVYVTMNGFLHDQDLLKLPHFIGHLQKLNVDACIVSDMGVASLLKKHSRIPLHVSTQASVISVQAALMWAKLGATRVILGREATLLEGKKIKQETGLEVEMFVHGSLCMAYSGHCVISNFTQGRDSNRGGCAHSCRFDYSLTNLSEAPLARAPLDQREKSYFMSSKDMWGIEVLEEILQSGIDSLKIEGRMKSEYYAAVTSQVYRSALDWWKTHGSFSAAPIRQWAHLLEELPHRDYFSGSLVTPAKTLSTVHREREHAAESLETRKDMVGVVVASDAEVTWIEVRLKFRVGDTLELLPFTGEPVEVVVTSIRALSGELLEQTKPSTVVCLPKLLVARPSMLLRLKEEAAR